MHQKLAENNTTLHAAYERLTAISSDEKIRILALNREKAIRDWNSSIHYAEPVSYTHLIHNGRSQNHPDQADHNKHQTQHTQNQPLRQQPPTSAAA